VREPEQGPLDFTKERATYQSTRTSSRVLHGAVFHEEKVVCTFTNGQPDSSILYKQDGRHSLSYFVKETCQLWKWCLRRDITLSAECLLGLENVVADEESCCISTSAEWKLHPEVFNLVQQMWVPCLCHEFEKPADKVCELESRPI